MKTTIIFTLLFAPLLFIAQNINIQLQNNPPVQQVNNPVQQPLPELNNNPENNDKNVNFQQQVNQMDWEGNKNVNDNTDGGNNVEQKKEPCPDCDKIKKAKRENYGSNYAGNYSGGAQKFKRKKKWKRFCYNLTNGKHKRKAKSNYSMCFNW